MGVGNKMMSGVLWSGIERITIQTIQFAIGIILARLLTPTEYGTVGLILVFIAISNVFINSGFTSALVQRQNRTEEDKSTVFLFNIVISLLCYLLLWFVAPLIADFYSTPILKQLLRVLSISLVINSLGAVPYTLFTIDLDFKTLTKCNFISILISGIVAIYMAYNGYGVWALVAQTITNSIIALILIWYFSSWKPQLVFSNKSFRTLFSYGSKLLISSLLNRIVSDLSTLLIGKVFTPKELGYYSRGVQYTDFVSSLISSIIERVLLPGLSPLQDNFELLLKYLRQILVTTAIVSIPTFFGLIILAKPIIIVMIGDKWLPAVPIMQIFCLARLITILSGINANFLYIVGRTDLTLKQQYINIPIRIVALTIALKYGIVYIALAELISTSAHYFINTYYPGKMMNYGALKQLKDISRVLLSAIIMAIFTYLILQFFDANIVKLILGPILGGIVYVILLNLLKVKEYHILIKKLKELKKA